MSARTVALAGLVLVAGCSGRPAVHNLAAVPRAASDTDGVFFLAGTSSTDLWARDTPSDPSWIVLSHWDGNRWSRVILTGDLAVPFLDALNLSTWVASGRPGELLVAFGDALFRIELTGEHVDAGANCRIVDLRPLFPAVAGPSNYLVRARAGTVYVTRAPLAPGDGELFVAAGAGFSLMATRPGEAIFPDEVEPDGSLVAGTLERPGNQRTSYELFTASGSTTLIPRGSPCLHLVPLVLSPTNLWSAVQLGDSNVYPTEFSHCEDGVERLHRPPPPMGWPVHSTQLTYRQLALLRDGDGLAVISIRDEQPAAGGTQELVLNSTDGEAWGPERILETVSTATTRVAFTGFLGLLEDGELIFSITDSGHGLQQDGYLVGRLAH